MLLFAFLRIVWEFFLFTINEDVKAILRKGSISKKFFSLKYRLSTFVLIKKPMKIFKMKTNYLADLADFADREAAVVTTTELCYYH